MSCSKSYLYQLFRLGKLAEALAGVEAALDENDNDGRLWELRGFICSQQQLWYQARHALEMATTLVPLSGAARVYLAECYRQTGLTQLASELATEMIGDPRISSSLFLALAALLDRVGKTEQSIELCQSAIEDRPQWAQAWSDLAFYLNKCDPQSGSIQHALQQAVRLDPHKLSYRIAYACRLASRQRTQEAYELICALDYAALNSVCCGGCLGKLQAIYELIGDEERAATCAGLRALKSTSR